MIHQRLVLLLRSGAGAFALSTLILSAGCLSGGGPRLKDILAARAQISEPSALPAPATLPQAVVRRDGRAGEGALSAVEKFLDQTKNFEMDGAAVAVQHPGMRPVETNTVPSSWAAERSLPPSTPRSLPPSYFGAAPGSVPSAFANTQVVVAPAQLAVSRAAIPVVQSLSVRPRLVIVPTEAPAQKIRTANEALDVKPAVAPMDMDKYLAHLAKRAESGDDFDAEWQLRFMNLSLHHDAAARLASSTSLAPSQDILGALIETVLSIRSVVRDPLHTTDGAMEQVDALRELLASQAEPRVSAITLCRKVDTFGVYEEMTPLEFVAGRETRTIVYCEIDNFQSEQADDGRYKTRLATRLEVLTPGGESVWQHEEPDISDVCRRRRSDFFIAQRVTLPAALPAGEYVLKVQVEDRLSGRAGESTHRFVLGSALSSAARP